MPLTPKAKYAREIARRLWDNGGSDYGTTRSERVSLASEYMAFFDDYEDRYRRAKVEALNEVIEELKNYQNDLESNGGLALDRLYPGAEEAVELAERVRLRYLKEGGE